MSALLATVPDGGTRARVAELATPLKTDGAAIATELLVAEA
ncbi:hypothetical protein [Kribbella sp. NPDC048915]